MKENILSTMDLGWLDLTFVQRQEIVDSIGLNKKIQKGVTGSLTNEEIKESMQVLFEDIWESIKKHYPYYLEFIEYYYSSGNTSGNFIIPLSLITLTHPDLWNSFGLNSFQGSEFSCPLSVYINNSKLVVSSSNFRFLSVPNDIKIKSDKFKTIEYCFSFFPELSNIGETFLHPFMKNVNIIHLIIDLLSVNTKGIYYWMWAYYKFHNIPFNGWMLVLIGDFVDSFGAKDSLRYLSEVSVSNYSSIVDALKSWLDIPPGDAHSASEIFNKLYGFNSSGLEKLYKHIQNIVDLKKSLISSKEVSPDFYQHIDKTTLAEFYSKVQEYYSKKFQQEEEI